MKLVHLAVALQRNEYTEDPFNEKKFAGRVIVCDRIVHHRRYVVYWDLFNPEQWAMREANYGLRVIRG